MTSTDTAPQAPPVPPAPRDSGFRSWHFYVLVAMVGATVAVMLSRETHPAALLLLSAAVISAGLVGVAVHHALAGFLGRSDSVGPLPESQRAMLEREKALTLRSIKELEFDHQMRKVSDVDFDDLRGRLRARALALMQELERTPEDPAPGAPEPLAHPPRVADVACPSCGTANDADARFCKQCGGRVGA